MSTGTTTNSTGTTGPAAKRAAYTGDSLLAVAVRVFNERGYDGTSMEDLAKAAGITKSSIYHHVKGKEELLERGVNRALDALTASLDEVETARGGASASASPDAGMDTEANGTDANGTDANADSALERVEQAVFRAVEVLIEELPYVTLLLRVRGNTEAERTALARRRDIDRRFAELVEAAVAEGGLRADLDPHLASRLVFGMVNSVSEWFRPGHGESADAIASAVVHLVFDGLRDR